METSLKLLYELFFLISLSSNPLLTVNAGTSETADSNHLFTHDALR